MKHKIRIILVCFVFAYLSVWLGLAVFISPQWILKFIFFHPIIAFAALLLWPFVLRPLSALIRWAMGYTDPWHCWWIKDSDANGEFWNSEMNEMDDE